MKLYEVPPRTWVKVVGDAAVPPGAPPIEDGEVVFFCDVDGMYSLCKRRDGTLCHLVAWQEVEVVGEPKIGGEGLEKREGTP